MKDKSILIERTTCKLGAQNFNECLKNSFNENWPSLHNPNKNDKFPLLDPFFFEFAALNFSRLNLFKGSFAIKNMTLVGQNQLKFTKIETTQNGPTLKVSAFGQLSQFVASGWFRSNLIVNELPFNSKGQFHLTCSDVRAKLVVTGDLISNGTDFNIKNIDLTPNVKNMKFNITSPGVDKNVSK
jgi:hypothetical protein